MSLRLNKRTFSKCLVITMLMVVPFFQLHLHAQIDSDEFWKNLALVRESGVPLGGIGAGKIDLCPDGAFRNMTFQNSTDVPISGKQRDEFSETGIEEAFFAVAVEGAGAKMLKVKDKGDLPGFTLDQMTFKGLYPFASIEFEEFGGMEIALEAFSPILLDDPHPQYLNSSLPAFIVSVKMTNNSNETKKVAALMSFPNIIGIGGYPKTRMYDPRGNEMYSSISEQGASILYTHKRPKVDVRIEGEMELTALPTLGNELSTEVGWWKANKLEDFGKEFKLPGTVADEVLTAAGAVKQGSMGSVAGSNLVKPGKTFEQKFILSWYFPKRRTNDNPDVIDKNFYAADFNTVQAVTKYVKENLSMLYNGTKEWQQRFEDANLPDWFSIKLINNISTLSANSVYLADGRFSINEAPTNMRGCMGTIDQRAASNSIYTFAFPNLAKSELQMFNETQIMKDSKERYSKHFNMRTGKIDLMLDRFGAIKHDIGRDDFEGGMGPSNHWKTTHWPDIGTVYILQSYAHAAWTNDKAYLKEVYPRMLAALEFQNKLDQNDNGIADLWGSGCCTYDSRVFQFFGDSPFIATLHLAAIRAVQKTAKILGDEVSIKILEADFDKTSKTLETLLWNEELGQYDKFVDLLHKTWDGTKKEHQERSTNRMIAQIAGNWFVNQLNLEPIIDAQKADKVLEGLYKHNVAPMEFTPNNEVGPDKNKPHSWPYYAETYYAANAIYEGRVDEGMEMEKRFAKGMFQHSGQVWDARLYWGEEGNGTQGWGRWYMSTPSSWFVLQALAGVHYDGLTQTLTVRPAQWSELEEFDKIPVFHPLFWATISKDKKGWTLNIDKVLDSENPLIIKHLITNTDSFDRLFLNGKRVSLKSLKSSKNKQTYKTDLRIDKPTLINCK